MTTDEKIAAHRDRMRKFADEVVGSSPSDWDGDWEPSEEEEEASEERENRRMQFLYGESA